MQAAAAGGVSWVAAQPSVLGRSAPALGTGRGGGGGCRVRPVGMVRCCARTQEKRPPRVRKTKEERREMVESFVNAYRVSNDGKFPSVNLTHKEVGGSYYIVREIVRDIIQENRVLGPGGLDATALSFEDCPDSSELEMKHKLGEDNMEILNTSGGNLASKDSVVEISRNVESTSLQKNAISVQTMLGSSNLLEAGVLNSVVQNGSAAGTSCLETSHENQDEVSCEKSGEADLNTSEEQVPSFAHISDSDKESDIDSLVKARDGTSSSITDGTVRCSEPTAAYETNGALLQEQDALHIDCHGGTADNAVNEENVLAETNGVLQIQETLLQNHDALLGSVSTDDVQILDGHASSTVSANQLIGSYLSKSSPENEVRIKTIEPSEVRRLQHELEQTLLDASSQEQEKCESLVSHPALDTKGLLQRDDKHSVLQVDESVFKRSTSGITKEDADKSDAQHEQGTGTTTTISRRMSKGQQKKEDNLFWLVLRAFVIAVSKLWTK